MKTLKSAILSSSLLLTIKSAEGRTWSDVVDHALYQHIAVDTERIHLRIESDPFLETPHSFHNGLPRDTSPPSASPTSAPCQEGSIHYRMNMYDTSGNGWQGTTIQVIGIKDQDTLHTSIVSSDPDSSTYTTTTRLNTNEGNGYVSISNTIQFGSGALLSSTKPEIIFPLGKVFESALTRGSSDNADICLVPRRCYDIVVYRGSQLEEVAWNLTAMVDNSEQEDTAYIQGTAPMYCKFSIPDANGEVFCPIECSEEIPEQYTQDDKTLADLFHPPVETGTDGGFSALYRQFAGKDKLAKDEPAPKGKYSMYLGIGEKGEENVETKPLKELPQAPVFDIDNVGLPSPPTEEESQSDTIEEETTDSTPELETEESPAQEDTSHGGTENQDESVVQDEGEGEVATPVENESPIVEEDKHAASDEGDQDSSALAADEGSQTEDEISDTPPEEGEFGESGSFIPLTGGDAVVQTSEISNANEISASSNEDDDSLASLGLVEEYSDLPLTTEVRSADDIQLIMDKTMEIPEYNGTMHFVEETAKSDPSESLPVDPTAPPVAHSPAPVKTDTFHMLLRHGGKR